MHAVHALQPSVEIRTNAGYHLFSRRCEGSHEEHPRKAQHASDDPCDQRLLHLLSPSC